MKKTNLLFCVILIILIVSCKENSKNRVNVSHLKTFFTTKIKILDSTANLETFALIKVDTITLKNQYRGICNEMVNKSNEYVDEGEKILEKVKLDVSLKNLDNGTSPSLSEELKNSINVDKEDLKKLILKDSLLKLDLENVKSLMIKSDSIKPVAYFARCFYTVRKKDFSISKDTTAIRLDLEFNILDREEYAKYINRLYKPISDFVYE
jgi:hypothetical protein